jgi:hypothetical protein
MHPRYAVVAARAGSSFRSISTILTERGQTALFRGQVDLHVVSALFGRSSHLSDALLQSPPVRRVGDMPPPVRPDHAVELGPHPSLRPLGAPTVSRRPGRAEGRRKLPPGAPRRSDEDDRREYLPVPLPATTPALRSRRRLGHHPLEQLPQLIRHQALHDPHDRRPPTASQTNSKAERECPGKAEPVGPGARHGDSDRRVRGWAAGARSGHRQPRLGGYPLARRVYAASASPAAFQATAGPRSVTGSRRPAGAARSGR